MVGVGADGATGVGVVETGLIFSCGRPNLFWISSKPLCEGTGPE